MPLYRPTELKEFLSSIGRGANASLSQNFLIDGNVIKKMGDIIEPYKSVLEIGPGPGVLTEELLSRGISVTAVEKDRELAEALLRFSTLGTLNVETGDILEVQLSPQSVVVGNIPYGISREICHWLIDQRVNASAAILMVQTEFAHKLVALPKMEGFGALSLQMQYVFDMKIAMQVASTCFWPKPKVSSSIIVCTQSRPKLNKEQEAWFLKSVPLAFSHRRKKLKAALGIEGENPILQKHVDQVSLEDWVTLAKTLNNILI